MSILPALSAGASIVSSISGLFGGKKKGPSMQDNLDAQAYMDRNRPSWVVEGANKAGLHPLAVLGMGGMSAPVAQIGGDEPSWGQKLSSMGQGVSRAASVYQTAEARGLEQTMAKLQVKNMELQNARIASEINLMNQPGTPPAAPSRPQLAVTSLDNYAAADDARHAAAILAGQSRYKMADGSTGWTRPVLNQMESDYLRVPVEYVRAFLHDAAKFSPGALARRLSGKSNR